MSMLLYTNLLLVLSFLFFLSRVNSSTHWIEYILAYSLVLLIPWSQLFWSHPIRGSTSHTIDSILAKCVILSFVVYTILYKFRRILILLLFVMIFSAYASHRHSKEWCSDSHLLCHGILHVSSFISTLYTFL